MRVNLILLAFIAILTSFLWVTLSSALLWPGMAIVLFIAFVTVAYPDKAILFFLGARELRGQDQESFFRTAAQEAYKLAVPMPNLYFYNGSLERGFVLQNKSTVSIILDRSLLDSVNETELHAICFELLLQVKKGMAKKRTRVMFLLGGCSWLSHSLMSLCLRLVPVKEFREAMNWTLNYLLYPFLNLLFRLTLGTSYFKKLDQHLDAFPEEKETLKKLGFKLRDTEEIFSVPSRKLREFSSAAKSHQYQNIFALEYLPHEWDFFFNKEGLTRAQ